MRDKPKKMNTFEPENERVSRKGNYKKNMKIIIIFITVCRFVREMKDDSRIYECKNKNKNKINEI